MIIHEAAAPGIFRESTASGAPVHLVICYSTEGRHALAAMGGRVLKSEDGLLNHRNSPLDCGSALQTAQLAAAACGLSSSRQTMLPEIENRLRERFEISEMIHPIAYIELGYSDEPALKLPKMAVRDTVLTTI